MRYMTIWTGWSRIVASVRTQSRSITMSVSAAALSGHTALVTGATAGFGRATAVELARNGAEIVVHGRSADRGRDVVDEITAANGQARFISADLVTVEGARSLADQAGRVDILVNNAGFSSWAPT